MHPIQCLYKIGWWESIHWCEMCVMHFWTGANKKKPYFFWSKFLFWAWRGWINLFLALNMKLMADIFLYICHYIRCHLCVIVQDIHGDKITKISTLKRRRQTSKSISFRVLLQCEIKILVSLLRKKKQKLSCCKCMLAKNKFFFLCLHFMA